MEKKLLSFNTKRERRFMLIVPLIFIPFLVLMFWAFKGIKELPADLEEGFLMDLPEAHLLKKDVKIGKMEHYERAKRDSLKKQENRKNDRYLPQHSLPSFDDSNRVAGAYLDSQNTSVSLLGLASDLDANEQLIYDKLDELNQALKAPQTDPQLAMAPVIKNLSDAVDSSAQPSLEKEQVDRLENLMDKMTEPVAQDEELSTLNTMLETIRAIQNPADDTRDRLGFQPLQPRDSAFQISENLPVHVITRLRHPLEENLGDSFLPSNRFHAIKTAAVPLETPNTIAAVIHQTQSLRSGDVVKLRLIRPMQIGGLAIPADSFVYGLANLNKQRLEIQISRIRMGNALIPVDLKVYDLDGLAGIHIPDALTRDVAKESAARSVQSVGLQGVGQSWSTQVALAGMETAKDFMQKKVRLVRVTLKAGYQVLLLDGNHDSAPTH